MVWSILIHIDPLHLIDGDLLIGLLELLRLSQGSMTEIIDFGRPFKISLQ